MRCGEREYKRAKSEQEEKLSSLIQQQQGRKLMASLFCYELGSLKKKKKKKLGTSLSDFLLHTEGTCSGSFTCLGKGLARELCSLPSLSSSHRALSQTNLESAVRAGTGDFGEDHHRLPLGRAARPSSNPKAKPA